ncbi:MAG: hypothetical protein KM310_10785 [Clostridiales bacterium]|nr:hypothetical protein [Clostridiales bacterium]
MLTGSVATHVLNLAREQQEGRVAADATTVAFTFTEGWFRAKGLTQAQIGERIGWSREAVENYNRLTDQVGAGVLDLARRHQEGRVPMNGTDVPTFTFTEWWFRTSGLYELPAKYQLRLEGGQNF